MVAMLICALYVTFDLLPSEVMGEAMMHPFFHRRVYKAFTSNEMDISDAESKHGIYTSFR